MKLNWASVEMLFCMAALVTLLQNITGSEVSSKGSIDGLKGRVLGFNGFAGMGSKNRMFVPANSGMLISMIELSLVGLVFAGAFKELERATLGFSLVCGYESFPFHLFQTKTLFQRLAWS